MTADDSRHVFAHESTHCFRVERLYFWVGVVGIPFGVAMGVGSTLEALRNVDGSSANPMRDAAIFATGSICFVLLGVGLVVYYLRFRLFVSDAENMRVGLLGTKRIELAQVARVQWRLIARDVVLRTSKERLVIEIDSFNPVDRAQLTVFLRTRIPPNLHHGWEQSRRKEHFVKVEAIHWGRIAAATAIVSAVAIPLLFLAAWIDPAQKFQRTFVITFFPSLAVMLYVGQKLGWIVSKPRIQSSDEPANTPAQALSPFACHSPTAPPSRG